MELAATGPASIRDGVLAVWDTSVITPNQFYTLKLSAKAEDGTVTEFLTRLANEVPARNRWGAT